MRSVRAYAPLGCLALVALLGCTDSPANNAADVDAAGLDKRSPPPPPPPRPYAPDGCTHQVFIPPGVLDFTRGDRSTFGAAPAPTSVHVTWPADPATTIAFLWNTDRATRATVVQYGTDRSALDREVTGHVASGGLSGVIVTAHEAHACGLTPDTTYYYRVGGEGHWSDVQRFKTAPAPGQSDYDVNFAVTGDSRDDVSVWRAVQERILSVSAMRQPDFEVFSGDAVYYGGIQSLWDDWFTGAAPTLRTMPFVNAHGNHEGLSINYLLQFALPQAGRPDQDELYFSFDYGPLHFVFINDTPFDGDYTGGLFGSQLRWLRDDLTRARARRASVPWVVAVHHKGLYSASTHMLDEDVLRMREVLTPVYAEFGVDLVLNGHDHHFEITHPLDGRGEPTSPERGTVYITAAAAGAGLYSTYPAPWQRYGESAVNFLLVHATMRALDVTPYRGDGTLIAQGRLSLRPRAP